MEISEKNLSQVPDNLLFFLRNELGDSKVDYEVSPLPIQVGNETYIFHFKLKHVHPSLSEPLVPRIFRKGLGFRPKHAIMESVVHNSLVDQGLPVPYVHNWFWTQPPILNELINNIYDISKIDVKVPD